MRETSKRLEKVWSEHQDRLAKENRELVKMALETVKEKNLKAEARLKIKGLIEVGGKFGRDSSTVMDSKDKLELVIAVLKNAEDTKMSLTNNEMTSTVVKSFKMQLDRYKKHLEILHAKLKEAKDSDERKKINDDINRVHEAK